MAAKTELRTMVKQLRSKLDRAVARVDRLKTKVAELEKVRDGLEARVKDLTKVNKRLKKAARGAAEGSAATEPSGEARPPVVGPTAAGPDATWTVAQLRAEARARGLTGFSGKTKAQLLEALA